MQRACSRRARSWWRHSNDQVGVPCTNKIDHCLRPGVWFAADNYVAGSLFRGTPVFAFENKWWTWRGDLAEQKYLFRTKVAEKVADVTVGKPVLVFFEDNGRKWLDNEYDMLTSSRWSVGVVDALGTDTVTIKGWGSVSIESVRVIVEEKIDGTNYLDIFRHDKLPLEKLFSSERLTLIDAQGSSASAGAWALRPPNPFM